jgi:hypothetical protein
MKLDKAQTGNNVVLCLGVDADLLVYMKYVPMKPSKVIGRVILLSLEQRAFVYAWRCVAAAKVTATYTRTCHSYIQQR